MEIKIYVALTIFILSLGSVFASAPYYEENYTTYKDVDTSNFQVSALRYEPYPVSPGEYFTIWIQVEKTGTDKSDVKFEFKEEYPFTLDPNEEAVRTYLQTNNEPIVLEYKVRVSDDAVAGENTLTLLEYQSTGAYVAHEFSIYVQDVQTSFDAVVQEQENSEISIAIANIGQNDANSAIVKIPEQDGVVVTGSNGQMVGNLEQGDYTIVGFTLTSRNDKLVVEIDYTDYIGERRKEYIEVSLSGSTSAGALNSSEVAQRFEGMPQMETSSNSTVWMWVAITIIILATLSFIGYKHIKKKKEKSKK